MNACDSAGHNASADASTVASTYAGACAGTYVSAYTSTDALWATPTCRTTLGGSTGASCTTWSSTGSGCSSERGLTLLVQAGRTKGSRLPGGWRPGRSARAFNCPFPPLLSLLSPPLPCSLLPIGAVALLAHWPRPLPRPALPDPAGRPDSWARLRLAQCFRRGLASPWPPQHILILSCASHPDF